MAEATRAPGGRAARWALCPVRLAFHLLYNQLAWLYDIVAWLVSRGQWQAWGQAVMPYVEGRRVLELGHGPGHLLSHLMRAGFKPVGLDRSKAMGKLARQLLLRSRLAAPLVRGAALRLPFSAATFQTAVTTFPSDTIMESAALSEVRRVLEPDGVLVIVPMAYLTGNRFIDRGLELIYRLTGQRGDGTQQIEACVAAAGFRATAEWFNLPGSRVMVVSARPVVG